MKGPKTFKIAGKIEINRMGFGAMRLTGPGIWGEPLDRPQCEKILRRLPELGVNFIDTADCYGPFTSENLICEVLHPYKGLVIATKGGICRAEITDGVVPLGRPEYLRFCVSTSLRRLNMESFDLWQLHRIDPKVPANEQFDCIREMIDQGKIKHAGLSEVSVKDIEAAQTYFPVATVQNMYNVYERQSEEVLNYCEKHGIGFIPFSPLGSGNLAKKDSRLGAVAQRLGVTNGQLALAWLLKRSPVIIPIPGTTKVKHLEENLGAVSVELSEEDFNELSELGINWTSV